MLSQDEMLHKASDNDPNLGFNGGVLEISLDGGNHLSTDLAKLIGIHTERGSILLWRLFSLFGWLSYASRYFPN
jgi:hypothetical protein